MISLFLKAQDYQITFGVSGSDEMPDSVNVENQNQNKELDLLGGDVLHLVGRVTGVDGSILSAPDLKVYPNPFKGNTNVELYCPQTGVVQLTLTDLTGKLIEKQSYQVQRGLLSFGVSGLGKGMYILKVKCKEIDYSAKLLSLYSNNLFTNDHVSFEGIAQASGKVEKFESEAQLKSTQEEGEIIEMQYNDDELLHFTGFLENYISEVGLIPSISQELAFDFSPIANFSSSLTNVTEGDIIQFTDLSTNHPDTWLWNFGDGGSSILQNPTYTFNTAGTYSVSLDAGNTYGTNTELKTSYITVSELVVAPVAEFEASATTITEGESITFTDQSTNVPTSWSWDFGDGGTSTVQNPSNTYTTAGTYTVSLIVTNTAGSDTETKTSYITVSELVVAPVAEFEASATTITEGESITFTDQSTNVPTSWSWDFGDGGTSTVQNPSHTYTTAGAYTVSLTATNTAGTDSETKSNYILVNLIDIDGNVYETIEIGGQIWMAENLRTTHYADGTAIPYVESNQAWLDLTATDQAYCWFDNSDTNRDIYGGLYTWAASMNGASSSSSNPSGIQGVCPDGWHLPSDAEWKELEIYLGMSQGEADAQGPRGSDEGGKLKESGTSHWSRPNAGATNESGFTALPGGFRSYIGSFAHLRYRAHFWTATEDPFLTAWYRALITGYATVDRYGEQKDTGYSVRCVRDD